MKDNITFLIGAGASYNALPIVSNWNERIEQFKKFLEDDFFRNFILESSFNQVNFDNINAIISDVDSFFPEAVSHATIDTYAKKLFLRGSQDDKKRLTSMKHLLGCFFAFEQMAIEKKLGKQKADNLIGYQGQEKQLDKRYDPFFATLLNPATKSLDERINIISWNYDLQLEIAYTDFYKSQNPYEKLKAFPCAFDTPSDDEYKIIKLNGTAGMVQISESSERIAPGLYGDYFYKLGEGGLSTQDSHEFHPPTLQTMLKIYSNYLDGINDLEPSINFAWEKNEKTEDKIKHAQNILSNSKALVVIGYSFPNFNREIDKQILFHLFDECKIYIQDLGSKVEGIKQRLKGLLLNGGNNHDDPIGYTDLDQFFIPYEL